MSFRVMILKLRIQIEIVANFSGKRKCGEARYRNPRLRLSSLDSILIYFCELANLKHNKIDNETRRDCYMDT